MKVNKPPELPFTRPGLVLLTLLVALPGVVHNLAQADEPIGKSAPQPSAAPVSPPRLHADDEARGLTRLKQLIESDPDRLHGTAFHTRNPMGWKWKVYLPPGKEWQIKGSVGRIPAGRTLPLARGTHAIDIAPAATGRIVELEAYISSYEPRQGWLIQVEADSMVFEGVEFVVFAMFGAPDKAEVAEYILEKRGSRSKTMGSLDLGSVTSKINDDLHLVRWYYKPKDEPENLDGPFPGFVIWIEAKDAKPRDMIP